MNKGLTASAALVLTTGLASAGGIERSNQSVGILFEEGSHAQFSFGLVSPDVSGVGTVFSGPSNGVASGDQAKTYGQFSFAYKQDLDEKLSFAIVLDEPYGAAVAYPATPGYFAATATADLDSYALTGLLRYKLNDGFSVHGGLRYQSFQAEAVIPFVGGYTGETDTDYGLGYVVGAAYERPDIALRVALTYNSAIEHTLSPVEFGAPSPDFDVETPQSLHLEFQTGIAADTLLFGGIRWVEWSEFDITPLAYQTATGGASLVSFNDDVFTYTLGLGRRFNETWSGAVTLSHEKSNGGFISNLRPTDGFTSLGLGATYTSGPLKVTGGVRYVWIGDAQTTLDNVNAATNFTGNTAIAAGIRIGYSF